MSTTLLALYRRPEGGPEGLATFLRRYETEHLPLIRQVPGLRALRVGRVVRAFGQSDLVLVARLIFDDLAALDAALASEPMRAAGRTLREIAPGIVTTVVVEPDHGLSHGEGGEGGHDGA
jgi:uncharacterized protein (TIGR02118 family)